MNSVISVSKPLCSKSEIKYVQPTIQKVTIAMTTCLLF